MDTIKINKQNTLMVAHRGVSGIEQENTCAAFVAAGNRSYFGIETDVHRTVDGKFVVFHDDTTGRVAIDNMVIEESTFDTLRRLLLTDTDGKKGREDLHIPTLLEYICTCKRYDQIAESTLAFFLQKKGGTLEEYISICKRYEKTAVLELKNEFKETDLYAIVDIIKDMDYLDHVIFISFCLTNLVMLRAKYPDQPAQYVLSSFISREHPVADQEGHGS